jgi:hypothetical protein
MDIKGLLHLGCAKVASLIKGALLAPSLAHLIFAHHDLPQLA